MAKRRTHKRRTHKQRGGKTRSRDRATKMDVRSEGQFGALKSLIESKPVILVLVYADWCGHCRSFKPDWKALEAMPDRNVPMVAINDEMFPKSPLNSIMKVDGYPTVTVVNTAQNIAVAVPNRNKSALSKLLKNGENLNSPPPPGTTLNDVAKEVNMIKEVEAGDNNNNNNNTNLIQDEMPVNDNKFSLSNKGKKTINKPPSEEPTMAELINSVRGGGQSAPHTPSSANDFKKGGLYERMAKYSSRH